MKHVECNVGDHVKISRYKNIFANICFKVVRRSVCD